MNELSITVTKNSYMGCGGPQPVGYNVSIEGRGVVLCGLDKLVAQRAGYRLAHSRFINIELDAIREELALI